MLQVIYKNWSQLHLIIHSFFQKWEFLKCLQAFLYTFFIRPKGNKMLFLNAIGKTAKQAEQDIALLRRLLEEVDTSFSAHFQWNLVVFVLSVPLVIASCTVGTQSFFFVVNNVLFVPDWLVDWFQGVIFRHLVCDKWCYSSNWHGVTTQLFEQVMVR